MKGHSSINLAAKMGIPVGLARPDQPPATPKTRIWIEARDIGLAAYHELAEYLTQLMEENRKPSFLRRKEKPKRIDLQDVLHDIDERVKEAFEKELQEVVGQIPPEALEESLAGFKQAARLEFLKNLLKYWPEFSQQIFELELSLAPPPQVTREQLARLKELQKAVDKAVEDAEQGLQAITQALDAVAAAEKEEHTILWGTQEQNKGRFKDLPTELLFAIKTRLAQWQGRQAGLHEKEKPLTAVLRRKW